MILAIDLGSTSFKAAVYDPELRELGVGSHPVRNTYGAGNVVEIPVAEAEEAFRQAIARALAAAGLDRGDLKAIAIDSQAQTFTVADAAGHARMDFVSWQDNRAVAACEALAADPTLADFPRHCSFGLFVPALHMCQVKHLQQNRSGWLQADDRILHLPTWFVQALTGEAVIDANLAAMSGMYSLLEHGWWQPALAATGVTPRQLPPVVDVGAVGALTDARAEAWGVPAGIPVILAGNDQTAGGYGARVEEVGAVLITLGTAQVAYAASRRPAEPDPSLVRGPYPGGLHYTLVCDQVGGSVVNWAQTVIAGAGSPEAFFELAGQAEAGCRGVTFNCDLHASGGAWQGIGFHTTPAELARSVVEGLAKRMAGLIATLPIRDPRYLVAGGGSKSPLWCRVVGDALGGATLTSTAADPLRGGARMGWDALRQEP